MPDLNVDQVNQLLTGLVRSFGRQVSNSGSDIVNAAFARIRNEGVFYSYDASPRSSYSELSGNSQPGVSRPGWLKNQYKCNQFVGDVLIDSGYQMPTYKMLDGTRHYKLAEALPHERRYFTKITSLQDLQIGDVYVLDYAGAIGGGGAHTEIISATSSSGQPLRSVGAHFDGAYERNISGLMHGAEYVASCGCWNKDGNNLYFLRPIARE